MPGKAVTTLDEVALALVDPNVKLSVVEQDPDVVAARIVQEILDSVDPLAPRGEAVGGRDLIGEPLHVTSIDWRNSDIANSPVGIFAVMHITKQDGSAIVVTCGSRNVLAQLYRLARDEALPFDACFRESETGSGNTVLWLERCKWEAGAF